MKHIKIMRWLGVGGALLVPALAVAALNIPNTFAAGDPVSAAEMNANFDAVKAKVEELEALQGTSVQAPVGLSMAAFYCGSTCPAAANGTIESVEHSAGSGLYVAHFTTPFAAQPVCTCTPTSSSRVCYVTYANPTIPITAGVRINMTNLSGAASDGNFMVMCSGRR